MKKYVPEVIGVKLTAVTPADRAMASERDFSGGKMFKRPYRDEIARIILFECSIFETDAEIKANQSHPAVQKAYRAADRIAALPHQS